MEGSIMYIRGKAVQVDISDELSEYSFDNARWSPGKLISSSPFRDDRAPSFFVNLDGEYAGTWADSGALDYEYARGNFVKLIAILNDLSYEEAGDYLIEKYGALYEIKEGEPIRVAPPKLSKPNQTTIIVDNPIEQATSPYLISRGIGADVQAQAGIGFDKEQRGFTAIPCLTEGGKVANILYRSTRGKYFFYAENSTPIKQLLFGIDRAEEIAVIVEGAIDALSWDMAGYAGVAVGGAYLSDMQAEIIKRSRIKRLYIGGDNDDKGRGFSEQVVRKLRGYIDLYMIDYGECKEKDANDVLLRQGVDEMHAIIERARRVNAIRPLRV